MKKQSKKAIKQTMYIVSVLIAIFLLLSIYKEKPEPIVSNQVLQYKPLVEKYAEEYEVASYVNVILAMMMQESGGRGNDPMQSSESYCGKRGCIEEPELSIKQGVYYFSETLKAAGFDVELAIQSYNFGKGFIQYVHNTTGTYSQEAAIAFSQEMYEKAPDKSIYTCLRKEAKQYNACYGDIYYVRLVMSYLDELESSP